MKRSIIFEVKEDKYVLKENEKDLFSINKNDLKFDSLSFYNNLYAPLGSSASIDLISNIPSKLTGEEKRLAEHVFKCVNEIIINIAAEICDGNEIKNDK